MSDGRGSVDLQEQFTRLAREQASPLKAEQSLMTAAGASPPTWAIQIVSLDSYNYYNVKLVDLRVPGVNPAPVAGTVKAFNLAESFKAAGTLTAGIYAVMWRVGSHNVFYVKP